MSDRGIEANREAGTGAGRGAFEHVPIKRVVAFWDARPCNIRHSQKPLGTREYFDEVEARKYFVEPHIPRFAEFARWNGKRVLEIGCGIGTDTINFARHGAEVTAVDISGRSLDVARARAAVYGLAHQITFYQANVEELTEFVPVRPYDLVYSFGVLHHTPHPSRAVAELRQYMRQGSTFKMMVYHRHSWRVLGILLKHGKGRFWDLDRLIAEYSEAQTGCPVTYAYSPRQIVKLLNGLAVKEIWVDHIFPFRISEYVRYRYEKAWYFRLMPRPLFRLFERHLGWHLCVTAEA